MVIVSNGTLTRSMTCAQFDALDPDQTYWTVESRDCTREYMRRIGAPYASYDGGAAVFSLISRRALKVLVDSPGGQGTIEGEILLQTIVVKPSSGERFISVGTTPGGTEILDNEVIRADTPAEFTFVKYFEDPTFYITISAGAVVYIVHDLLPVNPPTS